MSADCTRFERQSTYHDSVRLQLKLHEIDGCATVLVQLKLHFGNLVHGATCSRGSGETLYGEEHSVSTHTSTHRGVEVLQWQATIQPSQRAGTPKHKQTVEG